MSTTKVKEVRLGRNYLRVGDTCKVRLPKKTQFTSGWTVREMCEVEGVPHATVVRDGKWRIVILNADNVRRVAQTKNGERKR